MPTLFTPTPPTAASPTPRVRTTQYMTLACLVALIILCIGWEWFWSPLPGGTGGLSIKALPLLLAVPGVVCRRLYTFRWLSLLVWLYVVEGAARGYSDQGLSARLAWTECGLGILLFAACAAHVRARLKAGKALAATPPIPTAPSHAGPAPHG